MLTNRFNTGFAALIVFLLLEGCLSVSRQGSITTNLSGVVNLTVPTGFRQVGDLHDRSDFQFENSRNGIYLLGIADLKNDIKKKMPHFSRKDYLEFAIRNIELGIEDSRIASLSRWSANGLKNTLCEMVGLRNTRHGAVPISYTLLISENHSHYIQINSWSVAEKNNELCEMLETMMASAAPLERSTGSEAQGPDR